MAIFSVTGRVEKGARHGRELGFPTANLSVKGSTLSGAYAGMVLLDSKEYPAAVYADPTRELVEAHILDFGETIYGKTITITLLEKVADTMKFTNKKALVAHIDESIEAVRNYFKYDVHRNY